ncbi:MAG: hypothetical protein WB682_09035 [Candidatus Dormiibacterota bacterium]
MVRTPGRQDRRHGQPVHTGLEDDLERRVGPRRSRGDAGRYSIIKADSIKSAVELAKGCPVLQPGAKVTVYETFPAM